MERWLTKKLAAKMASVSEKTIGRAIRDGRLKRAKNGVRKVLIAHSEFLRWMNGEGMEGHS